MMAAYETAADWRETKALKNMRGREGFANDLAALAEAMDSAFAAMSWDDSAVKARSVAYSVLPAQSTRDCRVGPGGAA